MRVMKTRLAILGGGPQVIPFISNVARADGPQFARKHVDQRPIVVVIHQPRAPTLRGNILNFDGRAATSSRGRAGAAVSWFAVGIPPCLNGTIDEP